MLFVVCCKLYWANVQKCDVVSLRGTTWIIKNVDPVGLFTNCKIHNSICHRKCGIYSPTNFNTKQNICIDVVNCINLSSEEGRCLRHSNREHLKQNVKRYVQFYNYKNFLINSTIAVLGPQAKHWRLVVIYVFSKILNCFTFFKCKTTLIENICRSIVRKFHMLLILNESIEIQSHYKFYVHPCIIVVFRLDVLTLKIHYLTIKNGYCNIFFT